MDQVGSVGVGFGTGFFLTVLVGIAIQVIIGFTLVYAAARLAIRHELRSRGSV